MGHPCYPPQDVNSLLPPVTPPGVRPPERSWRTELAHMVENMLPAWASTHWGPHRRLRQLHACSRPPACCLGCRVPTQRGQGVANCSSITAGIACPILAQADDTRTRESRTSCQRPWKKGQRPGSSLTGYLWQFTPRIAQRLFMWKHCQDRCP